MKTVHSPQSTVRFSSHLHPCKSTENKVYYIYNIYIYNKNNFNIFFSCSTLHKNWTVDCGLWTHPYLRTMFSIDNLPDTSSLSDVGHSLPYPNPLCFSPILLLKKNDFRLKRVTFMGRENTSSVLSSVLLRKANLIIFLTTTAHNQTIAQKDKKNLRLLVNAKEIS